MTVTKAITNCKLVLENGIIWDATLLISGERIAAFAPSGDISIPEGVEIVDANGTYVGPGFVDIHVHGGGGYQTSENPIDAAKYFLRHGETSILCTPSAIATKSRDEIVEILKRIREAMKVSKNIKGIYMEGPYHNPEYGANKKFNTWGYKPITPEDFKPLVDAGGEDLKVWMIAPEKENIISFLEYARKVNPEVIFAVGHSEALPSEIRALGKYRPKIMTHTFNATGRTNYRRGLRSTGPDEYSLNEPEVYNELISDSMGIHVNHEMQQLLINIKGYSRVMLITDSTSYNNPPPEHYKNVTDLSFGAQGEIAGSKLTLDKACRNIMAHTNTGIAQAFLMASTTPARCIGLDGELGRIDIGLRADLVFVDDTFNVKEVMLGGEIQKF